MAGYSLDSSSLIDLVDRHYVRAVFPALWERMEALVAEGRLVVVDQAALECKSDAARAWLEDNPKAIQGALEVWERARRIVESVEKDHGVAPVETRWKGAKDADPLVIALAEERGFAVVTSENKGSVDHPKIPTVCEWQGVECLNLVEFFERERWSF